MKRKLLSILVLLCISASSAWADWNGGTYTVTANEEITGTVNVSTATLTINSGKTVTVNGSIVISGTLTVTGGGTLKVRGSNGGPGGGSSSGGNGGNAIIGNVVVKGANVDATGGNGGDGGEGIDGNDGEDGLEGGYGGDGGNAFNGTVIIYGGSVYATGGNGGNGGDGGDGGGAWWEDSGCDDDGNPTGDPIEHHAGQGGNGGNGGNSGNAFNGTVIFYGGSVTATGGLVGQGGYGGQGDGGYGNEGYPGNLAYAFSGDNVTFETTNYDMWCYDYNGIDYDENNNSTVSSHSRVIINASDVIPMTANLVGGAYWSTFYSNTGNFIAPEGTQVFAVNLDGSTLTMTEIADRIVESGEGVVLKKAGSGDATTTIIMAETESTATGDFSANSLTGTTTSITNPGNAYVLNYKAATGVGFYKLKASGTIGANKAFLTYPASAREFFLFDETTSISEELRVKSEEFASAVVFDLQGRRVQNPTKGLYIVNGKKVFINK